MTTPSTDRAQRLYPNTVRVLNRLIEAPATVNVLAKELHLAKESVQWSIDVLRRHRLLHIKSWQRSRRGMPARVWAAGDKPDAPEIGKLSAAEKSAAWRARGNDSHRSRAIQRDLAKISKSMTLAGMLGL